MSEVTNGGEKDRQWLAGVRGQVGKAGGGVFLHHMTIRKLIVLSEECLDRRAADEGAVTVEVMGRILSIVGIPGMADTAVYEVNIRRKP